MIFLGDIACPTRAESQRLQQIFIENHVVFHDKNLVANLEGLIDDERSLADPTPVLFNHSAVIEVLATAGCRAVGLANNHTLDLPARFDAATEVLKTNGIAFAGAGLSRAAAAAPIFFNEKDRSVIVLNACWDFLLYHQKNPSDNVFINEINENALLAEVSALAEAHPTACIAVFLHWSFDLETLPFPLHRHWSRALIDAGARLVVGCHSHCPQGGERHGEGFIVYGLGNFFLPNGLFAGGRLSFPAISRPELAFEFDAATGEATCHWFFYENENGRHALRHLESAPFDQSELLKKHAPYQGMDDDAYRAFYIKNRRKRRFIPVFDDFRAIRTNRWKTRLLKTRARLARSLAQLGMIGWQN